MVQLLSVLVLMVTPTPLSARTCVKYSFRSGLSISLKPGSSGVTARPKKPWRAYPDWNVLDGANEWMNVKQRVPGLLPNGSFGAQPCAREWSECKNNSIRAARMAEGAFWRIRKCIILDLKGFQVICIGILILIVVVKDFFCQRSIDSNIQFAFWALGDLFWC